MNHTSSFPTGIKYSAFQKQVVICVILEKRIQMTFEKSACKENSPQKHHHFLIKCEHLIWSFVACDEHVCLCGS